MKLLNLTNKLKIFKILKKVTKNFLKINKKKDLFGKKYEDILNEPNEAELEVLERWDKIDKE